MKTLVYRPSPGYKSPRVWRKVVKGDIKTREINLLSIIVIIIVVILFDTILIGRVAGLVKLPGEMSEATMSKNGALTYIQFYLDNLQNEGDAIYNTAKSSIFSFETSISQSKNRLEVGESLAKMVREVSVEVDDKRLTQAETVLINLIENDSNVANGSNINGYIVVNVVNGVVNIEDKYGILRKATKDEIQSNQIILTCPFSMEVVIENGNVRLDLVDLEERLKLLNESSDKLKLLKDQTSQTSGYAEIRGKGIEIYAYDAPDAFSYFEIVHERDTMNIIDILFSAGALGVQVGDERIVANTSIRCIGPSILVNQKQIAVNPIKIKAIGNPKTLKRALEKLIIEYRQTGKVLEVIESGDLVLNAYKN